MEAQTCRSAPVCILQDFRCDLQCDIERLLRGERICKLQQPKCSHAFDNGGLNTGSSVSSRTSTSVPALPDVNDKELSIHTNDMHTHDKRLDGG